MRLTGNVKTVKVRPIIGKLPPNLRRLPRVLLAAIRNVYNIGSPVEKVEDGHYRMETYLCTIHYTVPAAEGCCCLMRAYRKEAFHGKPDKAPFCVARYILEE